MPAPSPGPQHPLLPPEAQPAPSSLPATGYTAPSIYGAAVVVPREYVVPAPSNPVPYIPYSSAPPPAPLRFTESAWYTKVDYFHWNERYQGSDLVNEDGAFYTLGYEHRYGHERVRVELFGGDVHYDGGVEYPDGSTEPLSSHTNYIGSKVEYDFLFEPDITPDLAFVAGIGSRFWFRDLPDDVTASGNYVTGYQETWWTIYPYIGLEKRRDLLAAFEFFASIRLGVTAFTYQDVSFDDTRLYPRPGATTNLEVGIRSPHFLLSLELEELSWAKSAVNRDVLQPASDLFTIGLKSGITF